MIPILCDNDISFFYFFALEVVRDDIVTYSIGKRNVF